MTDNSKLKQIFNHRRFIILFLITVAFCRQLKAQGSKHFFTFTQITEAEFRSGLKNSYNAPVITKIEDTTKLEGAFKSIEKTFHERDKELVKRERCQSPRCLISFQAYYPTLDLYLFYIENDNYEEACFVYAGTNKMASGYRRYRGSYGVMSKDGLWVGLERQDADNYLQIEICKTSKRGAWSLFKFDFTDIDINVEEKIPMFWATKNTIYIATLEFPPNENKDLIRYYAIKFDY